MTLTLASRIRAASLAVVAVLAACSSGGGGGGGGTGIPASVPAGTGLQAIQMIGTWEIRLASVVDTNDPAAAAPLNGTPIVIGLAGVVSIGGLSVARGDLETVLGFPLDAYVNKADGKVVLYGITFDRRAIGGVRQQVGVAGGSVDENTISVEQFTSVQSASQASEVFVRSRYALVRISPAITQPAVVEGTRPAGVADLTSLLSPLFGR